MFFTESSVLVRVAKHIMLLQLQPGKLALFPCTNYMMCMLLMLCSAHSGTTMTNKSMNAIGCYESSSC